MNKILQEEPDDNRFDIGDKRELERNTTIPDENWVFIMDNRTHIFWDSPKTI